MSDDRQIEAIGFYLSHGRTAEAKQELVRALAQDPEDAWLHGQMARCLLADGDYAQALTAAERVVEHAPESGWGHILRAAALDGLDRGAAPVTAALREAVRCEPEEPSYHAALAKQLSAHSQHAEALACCDRGLALDPEDEDCLLAKVAVLSALGRSGEADAIGERVLRRGPENPDAQVQVGWSALRGGDHATAREHFLTALRIEPGHEGAREGLVTSIKARNPLYRLLLGWCFLCQRLGGKVWVVIIGLVVARRIFASLSESMPALAPLFTTLAVAIVVFALFTWIAEHVANALLLAHPLGRHALDGWQRRGAAVVGLSLIVGAALLGAWWADALGTWIPAAVVASFALPAGAATVVGLNRRQRPVALGMAGLVIAIGLIALVLPPEVAGVGLLVYLLLWVAFTWLHQILNALLR